MSKGRFVLIVICLLSLIFIPSCGGSLPSPDEYITIHPMTDRVITDEEMRSVLSKHNIDIPPSYISTPGTVLHAVVIPLDIFKISGNVTYDEVRVAVALLERDGSTYSNETGNIALLPAIPQSIDWSADFWAVVLKSTQKMVGHLYFKQIDPPEFLTWELGYIFNPAFHNQGCATEAAEALIQYGFDRFGIHRVIAHCDPENVASWRVLEKIGMRREGYFRKNIFFRRAIDDSPLWVDSFEYDMLKEDIKPSVKAS